MSVPVNSYISVADAINKTRAAKRRAEPGIEENQQLERIEWDMGLAVLPAVKIASLLRHPLAAKWQGMSYDAFCEAAKDMTTDELLQRLHELRSAR